MRIYLFAFLFCVSLSTAWAQKADSVATEIKVPKHRKNNIKINLTPLLLYRPGIICTYERVINKSQTLSIMGGYVVSPTLLKFSSDKLSIKDDVKKSGYMLGAEYRFYLKKENKFQPPHGVYIGPYFSYYHFHNERNVTRTNDDGTDTDLKLKTNINIANLGFQLGYQFVIAKRATIDLVMFGPAVSVYHFDIQLEGNNAGGLSEDQQEILDKIAQRAPVLGDLLEGKKLSKDGKADIFAGGFRYAIQVGFCF